jgi:hypothetical protein
MNCEKIADKIVSLIADGRITYPMIEMIGFWVSVFVVNTEAESKILTFCHSIIQNVKEQHAKNAKRRDLYGE